MTMHDTTRLRGRHHEPALADLLADPIMTALLKADGIARRELEDSLHDAALALIAGSRRSRRAAAAEGCPS